MTRALLALALLAAACGAPPRRPPGPAGVDWVRLPGGSFLMGSTRDFDSVPLHRVAIRPFEISRTPVTARQYRACVAAGACPAQNPECTKNALLDDDEPAVCVDWDAASAFARWAGGRLPSEAEWEYAARGAGAEPDVPDDPGAQYCPRVVPAPGAPKCRRPVCARPGAITRQGLCDMNGDSWEWVRDWYHPSYAGAPADGRAWEDPPTKTRVSRVGSWRSSPGDPPAGSRDDDVPDFEHPLLGFRVAR